MGSTNKTQRLQLPQFVDNDRPSWRGDVNSAFAAVDAYATETDAKLTSAVSRVDDAEEAIADYPAKFTNVEARFTAVEGVNTSQGEAITALNESVVNHGSRLGVLETAQETDVETAETLSTLNTAYNSFVGAQETVNQTLTAYMQSAKLAALHEYPGVDNTGQTECSAAIQEAIGDARARGFMLVGRGTFKINSTVRIDVDCDLSSCTFNYGGTGIAVRVGVSSGSFLMGRTMNLPKVYNTGKIGLGWAPNTVGIQLMNVYNSTLYVPQINNFESGLQLYAQNMGCAYNIVTIGALYNNRRNIRLSANATGWVNENKFLNGRLWHDSKEGTKVIGCRHVHMDAMAYPPNNNTWIATCLESEDTCDYNAYITGNKNHFAFCRWENTKPGERPRVYLDTSTGSGEDNVFMYGTYCELIEFSSDAAKVPTYHRYSSTNVTVQASKNSQPLVKFSNTASDNSSAWAVYSPDADIADKYKWSIRASANGLYFKGPDAEMPLLSLIANSGQIVLSNVTGQGSVALNGTGGAGMLAVNGINTSTTASAGSAGALPATPAGYMNLTINGTVRKIPYYA